MTSNYGMKTNSKIEWYFVADPEGGLSKLGRSTWPGEADDDDDDDRAEDDDGRKPAPASAFAREWSEINARLSAVGEDSLTEPEFVALRLCTSLSRPAQAHSRAPSQPVARTCPPILHPQPPEPRAAPEQIPGLCLQSTTV